MFPLLCDILSSLLQWIWVASVLTTCPCNLTTCVSHFLALQRCSSEMCVSTCKIPLCHPRTPTVSTGKLRKRISSWFVIILLECRFTWHICTPSLNKDYMVEIWISRIQTRFILVRWHDYMQIWWWAPWECSFVSFWRCPTATKFHILEENGVL